MSADILLRAEQLHLFRLLVWGASSVLTGTLVLVIVAWWRPSTGLLRRFAFQLVAWGVLEMAYVAIAWHGLRLPDLARATRLDRHVWFVLGLTTGGAGLGAALVTVGATGQRRGYGLIGTGLGVMLQCTALFLIDAQLAASILR